MSRYKPYPKYKPSGVEWLGDVPAHWEVKRLRFVAMRRNSNVDKKSYEGQKSVRLCNYTDVYYNERITNGLDFMQATATDEEIRRFSLVPGDVIITKDSEDPHDIGVPAIVSEPLDNVVCGYHLTILRSKKDISPAFLFRVLQSHPTKAHFYVESPGITRFGLSQDTVGNLSIPLAPLSEQSAIADFLDRETGRIDALVEKKRRFIELLKEKRQALITAAVTGRFDVRTGKPYPAYKPSGVEWLGDVPAHWEVKPFFAYAKERKESNKGMKESNLLSLSYGRIVPKDINTDEGLLPETFETYQVIHPNDIVFRLTDLQNDRRSLRSAICKEKGIITSAYLAVVVRELDADYVNFLMRSYDVMKVFYAMGSGMRQSMAFADMKRLPLVIPDKEEQSAIADFLDRETGRIDALIEKTEQSIELLREKRAALITAAVTGKIDVREEAYEN